jgi:hypothetical protein
MDSVYMDRTLEAGAQITVKQLNVGYMVPQSVHGVSVVMLHGATLTGKTHDTTPNGRALIWRSTAMSASDPSTLSSFR